MHRPRRRSRLLRSAAAFALLACAIVLAAQLAGVSRTRTAAPSTLVFDGTYETWMVKAPGKRASSRLAKAGSRLGGGKTTGSSAGGWYEVQLDDDVSPAEAEAAFAKAGAVDVEPVAPRVPYEDPVAPDTPATSAGSTEPTSHDDSPTDLGVATPLRTGPVTAPRLSEQWALSQSSDVDIDAPEAWQVGTGSGAVVAVIDTGVDASHPDLVGRVLPGRDFSGVGTPATTDKVGHGTHVASIIAGNGTSMAGVAPDAKILPLKVFADSAGGFSMSGYVSAIRYAADQGADVINISLGCGGSTSCYSQAEFDALSYAASKGVVVVTAAGNGDSTGRGMNNDAPETPDFPSSYEVPGLLSVTSSTRYGDWSTWANYGRATVDIAAPGEAILVAAPFGSYRSVTGTSFSAPMTTGVAALVAAANPGASADDIKSRIMSSVTKGSSLSTRTVAGGVLNANAALFAAGSANGGGPSASVTSATAATPRAGQRVGTPPVLSWQLPTGWTSYQVRVVGLGNRYYQRVSGSSRSMSHPSKAWRSGLYRWQVVARRPDGTFARTPMRAYRMMPRLGAWVTSGKIRSSGNRIRLRIGYAASEPRAYVRVRVKVGRTVLHNGRATRRRQHLRGVGSPRRGWFAYDASLRKKLRRGQKIVVEVRVSAGGRTLVRQFRATAR